MGIEHGVGSVLYNKWGSMKTRCYRVSCKDIKITEVEGLVFVKSGKIIQNLD